MEQILFERIPHSMANLNAFILSNKIDATEEVARLLAGTLGSLSFHKEYKLSIDMFSKLEEISPTTSLTRKLICYHEAAFISPDIALQRK